MKVNEHTVSMNMDYFSYKSLSAKISVVKELDNLSTSQNNFKSDESIKNNDISGITSTKIVNENSVIKDLSASLLKNISNTVNNKSSFHFDSSYAEAEAINFKTIAYVKTNDKEIELNLNVSLSRSFVEQTKIDFTTFADAQRKAEILRDPLTIELNGSFPSLSSKTFSFDIDSDGKENQISMLGANSAFLALDKNLNGSIDNGNELFGAKSGDGFMELRAYDDDKNGWIDENDKIFNKLRIWQKTESKNELIAIGEVGIGAIFLGDIDTPFSMKNSSNEMLGAMRQSSFFLFENAKAGIISQIDLVDFTSEIKEEVKATKNSLNKLQGLNSYKSNNQDNTESSDKTLEKLQDILKSLQVKLSSAKGASKVSLQAQIGAIQSQMMSLVSLKISA
ncbi:MAG: hypothetical protein WC656_00860 [Sulfurimonas sp.]|jgi:hypothetical protein